MAETMHLRGSIAGFAFDATVTAISDETVRITGTAGDSPCDLTLNLAETGFNLSGRLLNKDCNVNGTKSEA